MNGVGDRSTWKRGDTDKTEWCDFVSTRVPALSPCS